MKCLRRRNELGAIRPLDVAAILCILGVLAFVTLAGGAQLKQRAFRTNCRENLQKIGGALQSYANDNQDALPDCRLSNFAGPQWPWDIHTNLTTILEKNGAGREQFYCPANLEMNDDRHWNFWKNDPSPIRVIGYPMLLPGVRQVPRNLWRASLKGAGKTAEMELAFDATACMDDDFSRITGIWTDRSNHVRKNGAQGGNILFLDLHVAWRDFDQMEPRFRTIGPNGFVEWNF